jgi:hypothetical protein
MIGRAGGQDVGGGGANGDSRPPPFPALEQRLLCDAVRQERKLARAMGMELDLRLRGR